MTTTDLQNRGWKVMYGGSDFRLEALRISSKCNGAGVTIARLISDAEKIMAWVNNIDYSTSTAPHQKEDEKTKL